jgi:putative ABC transport system ATP-binding protein
LIRTTNLKKSYSNGETVIDLEDLIFDGGKSYCILGPSGCGKTTLLNMVAGIVRPTEGSIMVDLTGSVLENGLHFNGFHVDLATEKQAQLDAYRAHEVGYISQDPNLLEEFTVLDNLQIVGKNGLLKNKPETVLTWVGLESKAKSKVKNLSGGEKQRVSIARALLRNPKFMLCDEPTASLNYTLALEVMNLLITLHKKEENTLLVVTHDDRMSDLFDMTLKFKDLLRS